jgi:hypothetical protein
MLRKTTPTKTKYKDLFPSPRSPACPRAGPAQRHGGGGGGAWWQAVAAKCGGGSRAYLGGWAIGVVGGGGDDSGLRRSPGGGGGPAVCGSEAVRRGRCLGHERPADGGWGWRGGRRQRRRGGGGRFRFGGGGWTSRPRGGRAAGSRDRVTGRALGRPYIYVTCTLSIIKGSFFPLQHSYLPVGGSSSNFLKLFLTCHSLSWNLFIGMGGWDT